MSETITRNDLTNILNEVLPSQSVDYIVEQGTDINGWYYRKWNSGIAEAWKEEVKNAVVNSTWGNLYTSPTLSSSFPAGLFTSVPCVSIYVTGSYSAFLTNSSTTSKDTITYTICRPTSVSSSQDYTAHIRAVGTWK